MGYLEDLIVKKAKQIEKAEYVARKRDSAITREYEHVYQYHRKGFTNDGNALHLAHIPEECLYLFYTDPDLKAAVAEKDNKQRQMKYMKQFLAKYPDMAVKVIK